MKDYCRCEICRKFNTDKAHRGCCDICRRDEQKYPYMVDWLPELVKSFLGVKEICRGCRNSINHYMTEWKLCWADDGDEAIKWALCDWVRNHHFSMHFYPHAHAYIQRECCKFTHGRAA